MLRVCQRAYCRTSFYPLFFHDVGSHDEFLAEKSLVGEVLKAGMVVIGTDSTASGEGIKNGPLHWNTELKSMLPANNMPIKKHSGREESMVSHFRSTPEGELEL